MGCARTLAGMAIGACAAAHGAAGPGVCDVTAPVQIDYELFLAHQGSPSTTVPCSDLMKTHLAIVQSMYSGSGLALDFTKAVSGTCASYTPLAGTLADLANDTALKLLYGPQRSKAVNDFVAAMKNAGHSFANKLNIYYVWTVDVTGLHVRKADGTSENFIFIGAGARPDSLAHEFAHAFSLEHVNFFDAQEPQQEYCAEYEYFDGKCDFDDDNIMWTGRKPNADPLDTRTKILSGQKVRIMCNDTSAVVRNHAGYNPSPAMDCPDWSVAGGCPPLNPSPP